MENSEKARPTFEEMIANAALSGGALQSALDFAAYLRENGLAAGGEHGEVAYKGKCACYMHLDGSDQKPGPWTIWSEGGYSGEYDGIPMDARMKEIAWAHVNYCGDCGGSCSPGTQKVIFGKTFDHVCGADMAFHVPDAEALECVKKLLEMRKRAIDGMQ